MTFIGNDNIYESPAEVYDAFCDIIEKTGTGIFRNIHFDAAEGLLEYDNVYGIHVKRIFDMTQGAPELISDMLQWFFSMLDSIANL